MILSRRRFAFILAAACVVLGLGIRAGLMPLPALLSTYTPDVLWAMLVFFIAIFLAPRQPLPVVALAALGFALLMECSQLYQAQWINVLRATRIGGLLLGHGFLWSDVVCYGVGVGLGASLNALNTKFVSRN
jgi:hypothetical protein